MWLATEELFKIMAQRPSLTEEQIRLLIRRLLDEPLHDSPTADELLQEFIDGDGLLLRTLANRQHLPQVWQELVPAEREHFQAHFDRIADRAEVGVARLGQDAAQYGSVVREMRAFKAGASAAQAAEAVKAKPTYDHDDTRLRALERELSRAPEKPAATKASPQPPRAKAASKSGETRTMSALYPAFIREKSQPGDGGARGYSLHTVGQAEKTFELWIAIVGDTRVTAITGEQAQELPTRFQVRRLTVLV